MSITPFVKLGSQDVLAAHPNGIQYAINNIETILNMKTATKSGQPLSPVTDMTDPADRYRIYEATDRSWLTSPSPVIKRNGAVVSSSEYTIQHAYGAVIFNAKQLASDAITADFTHVTNGSTLGDNVASLLPLLKVRTNTLLSVGNYMTHTANAGSYATNVNVGANNMDAFPFLVTETSVFDKMRVNVGTAAGTAMKLAVYSDLNNYPNTKLAETPALDTSTTGYKEGAFVSGDLTLQPGLYWLVRWQNGATLLNDAMNNTSVITLGEPADTSQVDGTGAYPVGAIRYTATYTGTMPNTYPSIVSGAKYLRRTQYGSPWIKRKA